MLRLFRHSTMSRFLLATTMAFMSQPLFAADFAGAGGPIPDANPVGLNVTFSVSGIARPVGQVRLNLGLTHSFVADLHATLISPGGTARLVIFSRAGFRRTTGMGISANLAGNYVFDDAATSDLWVAMAGLTTAQVVAPGTYRTSTAAQPGISDHGGCSTFLTLAFAGLTGAQVNGTWTLNIADMAGSDTGSVNSALLSIDPQDRIFASGFEDSGPGLGIPGLSNNCRKSFYDFTGTGLASYTVVRNTGGGPSGAMTWFVKNNDGTAAGTQTNFIHGIASDFFLDGDFDGDGISDATVYRPSTGSFLVRRSSRPTDTVLTILHGAVGDDPKHIGDYDGDGVSDAAVYRAGAASGDPSFTLIRLSNSGGLRTLATGENGGFPSSGIDYDGNGQADVAIQTNGGGGVGRFRFFSGISGALFADFNFGTPTDVIVTGSHFGSAVGDVTAIRGSAGNILWTTRDTDTGIGQPAVVHGNSATDFPLSGDYDGDGFDDYAIWRPSVVVGDTKFIVRRSLNPGVPLDVPMGQNGDYPPANTRSH